MPANEFRTFDITIPHGTTIAAPQVTTLAMPPRTVESVRIRFPAGPNGLVGCALAVSGQNVAPYGQGNWLIGNDEVIPWEFIDQPNSGAWQLIGYNTGTYDHTIYLVFTLSVIPPPAAAALVPIPAAALSGTVSP